MNDEPPRPKPEDLLAAASRGTRGRLRVFLGAAPGVGKTYAMLEAAQRARQAGVDVVVGVVETHGRAETEALLRGLELLPGRLVRHGGRGFQELDLDSLLARAPRLALIDEFAHSNLGDTRHPKRWQDVEDLRDNGIDVWTTLNVQHLESLNDVVARITNVRVRETVPDKVLGLADDIELIDLTPDDLLLRLRQGKVYLPDQAQRAIHHFFSKGTLTALRELALRAAADRIDAEMIGYMREHAIPGPWPTQDRLMVCVGPSPSGPKLVRTAKRMADRAKAPWIALHVAGPEPLPAADAERLSDTLCLAQSLGGDVVTLPAESDLARAVLAAAAERNVSRIVLGRPRQRAWYRLGPRPVSTRVMEIEHPFEVTVVTPDAPPAGRRPSLPGPTRHWRPYAQAALGVALATPIAYGLWSVLPLPNIGLVYLVAVLVTAIRAGHGPAVFASLLSFLAFNFLFTEPRFTLTVAAESDILTILFFLLVAMVTATLAARLRRQVEGTRRAARRSAQLADFARRVAGAAGLDDVLWAVVHHAAALLRCRSLVLLPRDGRLEIAAGYPPEDQLDPVGRGAADWAFQHGRAAGCGTDTLPATPWQFLPMGGEDQPLGVLGVAVENGVRGGLSPDQRGLAEAVADQAAVAIGRAQFAQDIADTRLLAETEKLRAALLSSVSHDLRTPLVSIIGAADSLKLFGDQLSDDRRAALLATIGDEAQRLNRFVQNLLDMTRIGYGALKPALDWVDIRDVIGRARAAVAARLPAERIRLDLPAELPLLQVDAALIETVLVNLLDNAAKYAPPGTPVTIAASAPDGQLVIEVIDSGPGIAEADRGRVFDLFFRVEDGDQRPPGTGLGLAICRGVVEAHGGTIAVSDGLRGIGTRISISLPVVPPPAVVREDDEA